MDENGYNIKPEDLQQQENFKIAAKDSSKISNIPDELEYLNRIHTFCKECSYDNRP